MPDGAVSPFLPNPAILASSSFGPWANHPGADQAASKHPDIATPLINLKHGSAHLQVPRVTLLAQIVARGPHFDDKAASRFPPWGR
ncbi:hypothetical protein Trco_003988 [Trichoderma cornu-damae]|uniref:Uncharacterized protein n=1 Tax=Trichoderma cornu-damae TaxID=654480 RepID=A0A9P8QLM2_9HYPO|nr:hypothetical protein Trco_003988 [Trichoderma cornu-damae]